MAGPAYNLRESEVGEQVRDMLKRLGWLVYSLPQGRVTRQTPGLPDLWAMHPAGRPPFWVELKTPTGIPSREQVKFAGLCQMAGTGYVIGGTVAVRDHLVKIGALP